MWARVDTAYEYDKVAIFEVVVRVWDRKGRCAVLGEAGWVPGGFKRRADRHGGSCVIESASPGPHHL